MDEAIEPHEAAVRQLVATWVKRLGLEHWELELHLDAWQEQNPDEPGRSADANMHRARDYDTWRTWKPRKLHATIVHELLHLVTRDVEHVLDLLDGKLHRDVDAVVCDAHRHAVEGAIDRLAYRLVDLAGDLAHNPTKEVTHVRHD